MSSIGTLEWMRLLGAHEARKDTHAKVEEITGDWKAQQKRCGELEETFDEAMETIETAKKPKDEDSARVISTGTDLRKAQKKLEVLDRKRRKLVDLDKKLNARVYQILDQVTGTGGELKFEAKPDPEAWKHVPIEDILSEMHAMPFVKLGIKTIDDAATGLDDGSIDRHVKGGQLTRPQVKFLTLRLVSFLNARAIKHTIEVPKGDVEVPDEFETAKAPAVVPRIGWTIKLSTRSGQMVHQGEVLGGGTKELRLEVHSSNAEGVKRGETVTVAWPDYEIEEIDGPSDALRVDQPKAGGASEMGGKKSAA